MSTFTQLPANGPDPKAKGYVGPRGTVTDGMMVYTYMQVGDLKFNSTTEREYCTSLVVDKTTAKAFKKAFPKNGYKEVDTADFEDKYKVLPLYPDEDEQFIIKFAASTVMKFDAPAAGVKAGDKVPYAWASRPKALSPVEGGVKDITFDEDAQIGNGTKGHVAFSITSNDFGTFPQFRSVYVTELVKKWHRRLRLLQRMLLLRMLLLPLTQALLLIRSSKF